MCYISCRHESVSDSVGSSIKRIVGFVFLHPCELYRMMDFYRTTLCPTIPMLFSKNFPPHSLVSLNWGSATRISEEDRRRKRSLPNNPLNYQVCCLHVNFVSDPVMIMILSNKSEIETKYSKIVGRNICSISIHTSILYITAVLLTRWKLLIFSFIIVIIIPII